MPTTVSNDLEGEQMRVTAIGGAKGFLGGAAVALPASYILHRRWPYYRSLPPSLKAFGVILVVVPAFVINAERTGLRFQRENFIGAGKEEMDAIRARDEERWRRMSVGQKIGDMMSRHQLSFILGGWSLAMLTAWTIISRRPFQTTPQKVVQARMWAQGLTIGTVIAAGVATSTQRGQSLIESPYRRNTDHSWEGIIEHEVAAKEASYAPQRVPRSVH